MKRLLLPILFVSVAGCIHGIPAEPADSLAGTELPLVTTAGVRVAVAGSVEGEEAEVALEVAQPRTTVSVKCFKERPDSDTTVRFATPRGTMREASEIELGHSRIGNRRLGAIRAALTDEDACRLTLGSDVLAPYALTVDPAKRTLRITGTRPRSEWQAEATRDSGLEVHVLELMRDPASDWPMLAVRARQGEASLTGAFVLSTSSPESTVGTAIAESAHLQRGPELLRDLGFPATVEIPKALAGPVYTLQRLELTPGFGFDFAALRADDGWTNKEALGLIGGDVWGHFIATVDPAAGVLVLRRPQVTGSDDRQRCASTAGVEASREGCFVLDQQDVKDGVELTTTVWRDLPSGARLYLDVLDQNGQSVSGLCRVGISLGRSDRGISSSHVIPWSSLAESVPECAESLGRAARVEFSLWENGPLSECPGNCAFVWDTEEGHVSCECETSGAGAMSEAQRRFLQMYQDMLERGGHLRPQPERDEPEDPDEEP